MAASVMSLQVTMVGIPEFCWGELRWLVLLGPMLLFLAAAPGALRAASQKLSRLPLLPLAAPVQVLVAGMPEDPVLPVLASELFGVAWGDFRGHGRAFLAMLLILDVAAIAAAIFPTAGKADVPQMEVKADVGSQAEDDASQELLNRMKIDRGRCWSESTAATESPMEPSPRAQP